MITLKCKERNSDKIFQSSGIHIRFTKIKNSIISYLFPYYTYKYFFTFYFHNFTSLRMHFNLRFDKFNTKLLTQLIELKNQTFPKLRSQGTVQVKLKGIIFLMYVQQKNHLQLTFFIKFINFISMIQDVCYNKISHAHLQGRVCFTYNGSKKWSYINNQKRQIRQILSLKMS